MPRSSPLSSTHSVVKQARVENARAFIVTGRSVGRAVRLRSTSLKVRCALVRANPGNAGLVHVGDASVTRKDPGLAPGRTLGLRGNPMIDLFDIFVVANFPDDGVQVVYAVAPPRHDADWTMNDMIRKAIAL